MNVIRYTYKSGDTLFSLRIRKEYGRHVLEFTADLRHIEGGKIFDREYDIFEPIDVIHMDGEYVYLFHADSRNHTQVKFEYGSCIVIDDFNSRGEHMDSRGSHDFNDELDIED
jgi:hypothetical protein